MGLFNRKRGNKREHGRGRTQQLYSLDIPLLNLPLADVWTLRDAIEGIQIFGATGSGKTSGSGATIAKSFLAAGYGGLVCCAKPDERELWERYATETGRTNDLVIFSPNQPWRFNFLDYELRREGIGGGHTENLVSLLTYVTEIAEGNEKQGGGDPFWSRAMREMLRNGIDIIRLAGKRLTLDDLAMLIASAPQSREQAKSEDWLSNSFCADLIAEAATRATTPADTHDLEVSVRYWTYSFAYLADKTRSSIVATYTSVADMLSHGLAWELFSTTTNLIPETAYRDGAIIVLDLSVQEYNELGRTLQGIFKLMFQRAILRRKSAEYPRPVFLWADESQNFISSFDYQFQAVARTALACTVYLTQNINNYYAVLGERGTHESNSLLGNLKTKIFHENGDQITNNSAAGAIGNNLTFMPNFGSSAGGATAGASASFNYKVQPSEFTTLRTGGKANDFEVDCIIFKSGRRFTTTGDTYTRATFKQS